MKKPPPRSIPQGKTLAALPREHSEFQLPSKSECTARNEANAKRWLRNGNSFAPYVAAIKACAATAPCNRYYCSQCTGDLRAAIIPQAVSCFSSQVDSGGRFITVYLDRFAEGDLADCNLGRQSQRLRMMLARSGFETAIAFGGLELGYRASDKAFLLHAHLAVSGASLEARERLRCKLKKSNAYREMDDRQLRDLPRQLSYCLKFPLYHRPGKAGASKARAYPLPRAALFEFLQWQEGLAPKDFIFLYGIRWAGGSLRPARKKQL